MYVHVNMNYLFHSDLTMTTYVTTSILFFYKFYIIHSLMYRVKTRSSKALKLETENDLRKKCGLTKNIRHRIVFM
jgi:hypothetical protein